MYFLGMAIFMIFVTRAGDVYGRKWPVNLSALASIPITIAILFSKNIYLTTALLFLFGATCPGREQVSFVYMCELVPVKNRTIIGSILLFSDATTIGLLALYFRFLSKNWLYFQYVSCGLNLLASLCLLAVPESPKYLHSKGNFKGAKDALAKIASMNRVKDYVKEFKFVEEVGNDMVVSVRKISMDSIKMSGLPASLLVRSNH